MIEELGTFTFLASALAGIWFVIRLNGVPGRPWRASAQGNSMMVREIVSDLLLLHIVLSSWYGQYAAWEWVRLLIALSKFASLVIFYVLIFRQPAPSRFERWLTARRLRRLIRLEARAAQQREDLQKWGRLGEDSRVDPQ